MPSTQSTAVTAASSPPIVTSHNQIIPATLQSHGLQCKDETPASAQQLLSQGQLNAEDFIETSPDIERTLMEAFMEDDFDGNLRLMTLSIKDEIVGMSFWREIPSEEMREWMDLQRISNAVAGRKLALEGPSSSINATTDLSHNANKSMKLVKSDSVRWIETALQPCQPNKNASSTIQNETPSTSSAIINELTHAWIKIELIAIKRTHRSHHLGNILLGCTLAKAHAFHHNEHAILHIAGGGASKNIPAARLYERYGFVPVPKHEEGGPFAKPDRDLFVLGNIGMVLNALPWEEMMQIRSIADDVESDAISRDSQGLIKDEIDSNNEDDDDNGKKAGKSCH